MALKAVVYPQAQDHHPFGGYGANKDFYNYSNLLLNGEVKWGYEELNLDEIEPQEQGSGSTNFVEKERCEQQQHHSSETTADLSNTHHQNKRRRAKSRKNKEQIENQRMTHIAVERNRRKQMNHYLSVLRSMMPHSYVQRGDQASIIGGAINFVKELEQRMHFLGAHKEKPNHGGGGSNNNVPFCDLFTFPQYSTTTTTTSASNCRDNSSSMGEHCGIADIEVTMVESHANLKVRSKKRPKQLLKMVSGMQHMRLTILHLNVTTTSDVVLYSLSVKVDDDCKLGSVDDIAAAVYQLMDRIQQEANVELRS